ncbi:hypothetical protein [Microbacterium flavescens]|uniref:hypothetical protein n=1 Tax=Microbacterium flavescens TaxID=69366 RepID=UPI001BDDE1B7|nr:hypothetical protein [Microbacterium flavescens]BFF12254.1 hypothetical protein GCM10025699_35570 [Microbacterium flavescens]
MKKWFAAMGWMAVGMVGATALVVVLALSGVAKIPALFSTNSESTDTQIVQSVKRIEEVALVSLGIQGIKREGSDGKFFGIDVPAGDRLTLLEYKFTAKLGIDGQAVTIDTTRVPFVITIPEFTFIGYDQPLFQEPIEQNGTLAWLSREISQTEMINGILSPENQEEYIATYKDDLEDQATLYYTSIITAIDPDAELTFVFEE